MLPFLFLEKHLRQSNFLSNTLVQSYEIIRSHSFHVEAERNSVQSFQDPLSSRRRVRSEPRDPLSQSPLPEGRTLTDPLSMMAEQISVGSQDTGDGLEALPRDEGSRLSSVGRQTSQRSLAVDNHGYDNSEATDSISTWSSEVCALVCYKARSFHLFINMNTFILQGWSKVTFMMLLQISISDKCCLNF